MMVSRSPDWMTRQTRTLESLLCYQRDLIRRGQDVAPERDDGIIVLSFRCRGVPRDGARAPALKGLLLGNVADNADLARRFPIAARAIVISQHCAAGTQLKKLQRIIFTAQHGLCFHCDNIMLEKVAPGQHGGYGWSAEHIHPLCGTGRGMSNNVVFAHPGCNGAKGGREPTEEEIAKGRAIYAILGLEAFLTKTTVEQDRKLSHLMNPPVKRGKGQRQ